MRRFFTEPENIRDGKALLIEDAAHITKVLRMEPGDEILVFDGSGMEYTARLTQVDKKSCCAEILSAAESTNEPAVHAALFQGIPKAGKMEQIVQKAVELGAAEIYPVMMERSVVRLDSQKAKEEKSARWSKVAQEAAKQCGRGKVPAVRLPLTFAQALEQAARYGMALMPYEELGHAGQHGLKNLLRDKPADSYAVLIGPEGGFSDAEAMAAKQAGVSMTGLGKRILRTETAGSTVLSIIMYENDEI